MSDEAADYVAEEFAKDAGLLKTIQNITRPPNTFSAGSFAGSNTFTGLDLEEELNLKAGAYAAAGVGYARAECSIFCAEAKGPNVSAGVRASLASGARAFAKAELASASASAGPLKVNVGLAADTGIAISSSQIEAKVLGTGFSIGSKISVFVLGTGFEIDLF